MARRRFELLVDELLEFTESRGLQPGDALPAERELAAHFHVSRNVLRQAFGILEERGLLHSIRGSGRYLREAPDTATTLGPRERVEIASIADLLEARTLLEVAVAGLACERRTSGEAATLLEHAGRLEAWEDNLTFHCAVAATTHNFMLERLVRDQAELAGELQQRRRYDDPEELQRMRSEHQAIATAITAREAELAQTLMREHLIRTRRLLVEPQPGKLRRSTAPRHTDRTSAEANQHGVAGHPGDPARPAGPRAQATIKHTTESRNTE